MQSTSIKTVSNNLSPHGREATFLERKDFSFKYTADDLKSMIVKNAFSNEDAVVFNEIVLTLENTGKLPFDWTPQEQFFVTHNPVDRIIPYIIYRFKFRLFAKRQIVPDFPIHLLVEPSSACDLRCIMCYQVDKTFNKKPYIGMMDFGIFKEVIDQAAEGGTRALSLQSRGEPLLNEHFAEMLRYVSNKKTFFDIKLNTNATHLDEAMCHEILSSDMNVIVISIDSHQKEIYEEIRVRGKFDNVLGNIKRLCDIREKEYPNSRLEIRTAGVKFRDDQDEAGFYNFWSEIVDTVAFVRAQERWDTYKNAAHPEHTAPCELLWNRLYVWFDGKFSLCDEDYKGVLSPGNILETSIRDVWHGKSMTLMRESHIAKKRGKHFPCDRCGV
jgi:MoaA/NifB/PqqE/SkfB family radical SAM enzyme